MTSGLDLLKRRLSGFNDETLAIRQDDISNEFAQQAALYAHWSRLLAEAEALVDHLSHVKDIEYAAADQEYRVQLAEEGTKYTEKVIESLVTLDDDYQEAVSAHMQARKIYQTLRGIVKATDMRADMLVSLGAHLRAEMQMTGMRMNEPDMEMFKAKLQEFKDSVRDLGQV